MQQNCALHDGVTFEDMPSPSPFEIASAIAAVVSAVGGAYAAVAAFRSAAAAQQAAASLAASEKRALLREVSSLAATIQETVLGLSSRGKELLLEYRSAEVFSGSVGNSALLELARSTQTLIEKAESFVPDAQLFSGGAKPLCNAPPDEVERVRVRLSENLGMVRVIREELDRKHSAMAARNLQSRRIALESTVVR